MQNLKGKIKNLKEKSVIFIILVVTILILTVFVLHPYYGDFRGGWIDDIGCGLFIGAILALSGFCYFRILRPIIFRKLKIEKRKNIFVNFIDTLICISLLLFFIYITAIVKSWVQKF